MISGLTCLVCEKCGNPLATKSSIIHSKASNSSAQSIYAYQLALLDEETCWCYTATSHDAVEKRFDVVRVRPVVAPANPKSEESSAAYVAGHDLSACSVVDVGNRVERKVEGAWFTGMSYRPVYCAGCTVPRVLGWSFAPNGSGLTEFLALILTRTRERTVDMHTQKIVNGHDSKALKNLLAKFHALAGLGLERLRENQGDPEGQLALIRQMQVQIESMPAALRGDLGAARASLAQIRLALQDNVMHDGLVQRQGTERAQRPRGPLTTGEASIMAMRSRNGQGQRSRSHASIEAERLRARQNEEEPWISRMLAELQNPRRSQNVENSPSSDVAPLRVAGRGTLWRSRSLAGFSQQRSATVRTAPVVAPTSICADCEGLATDRRCSGNGRRRPPAQ